MQLIIRCLQDLRQKINLKLYTYNKCGCNHNTIFSEGSIFTFPTVDVCLALWPGSFQSHTCNIKVFCSYALYNYNHLGINFVFYSCIHNKMCAIVHTGYMRLRETNCLIIPVASPNQASYKLLFFFVLITNVREIDAEICLEMTADWQLSQRQTSDF